VKRISEAKNTVRMTMIVTKRLAVGIVVLTGSRSVMGRIASMTAGVKQKSTLIQRETFRDEGNNAPHDIVQHSYNTHVGRVVPVQPS
jgi:hypothetical protein